MRILFRYDKTMKFLILTGFFVFIGLSFLQVPEDTVMAEQSATPLRALLVEIDTLPEISAKAYEVFDMQTGDVLFAHNTEESLPIASVTKLFTAAKVIDSNENESLTITQTDVATYGRSGKLETGQEYSGHELLFPLLIESSNDAATALARTFGDIPLAGHVLDDASGLSANNIASVSELATEVRSLYERLPHVFDVTTLQQYVGEHTGWVNNSPVFDLPGYKGGKHGYTEAARQTLVAVFSEESLEDRELGYVLLGSDDVRADTELLRATVKDSVRME